LVVLPCLQAKIREKVEYGDLEGEEASSSAPALKLARLDPYLHGPTPVIAMQYSTSEDMIHACQAFTQEMMAWQSQQTQVYIMEFDYCAPTYSIGALSSAVIHSSICLSHAHRSTTVHFRATVTIE